MTAGGVTRGGVSGYVEERRGELVEDWWRGRARERKGGGLMAGAFRSVF